MSLVPGPAGPGVLILDDSAALRGAIRQGNMRPTSSRSYDEEAVLHQRHINAYGQI